jgi:hypothetical protein
MMRRRGERGETLAEVLVSTTLLGIIGIGIIGAIASVLISTDIDRRVSAGETVLRSYVAVIEAADYQPCNLAAPDYSPGKVDYTPPPNFTAGVTNVKYQQLPAAGGRPITTAGTVPFGGCSNPDPGVQLISAEVKSTGARQTVERVQFVKRDLVRP